MQRKKLVDFKNKKYCRNVCQWQCIFLLVKVISFPQNCINVISNARTRISSKFTGIKSVMFMLAMQTLFFFYFFFFFFQPSNKSAY